MPGDEVMGTYAFEAAPLEQQCELSDVPATGFGFTGTFTRDSASTQAWFRLNNVVREGEFDGQVFRVGYAARRVFTDARCGGCSTELSEVLTVAILSKSQNDAAGDGCPDSPLDGGVPQGAGVTPPGPVANGFDAVRACGELENAVLATPLEGEACAPECGQCALRYRVNGARR